ncbi:MAG: phenylalanine 4-monooxygenase, partial [Myxococcota bacterium]|nr:phenylalanine 4-monooxygenase [Myxococcota bacterium]
MDPPSTFTQHAGGQQDLVELDQDHPGFRDHAYRQRRNTIAQVALSYRTGHSIPEVPYTDEENRVWGHIQQTIAPLHEEHVCREIRELQDVLPLPMERIPQLAWLNPRLENASGFRMEPVAGLVTARTFMRYLGRKVFLSTQYIRHHS